MLENEINDELNKRRKIEKTVRALFIFNQHAKSGYFVYVKSISPGYDIPFCARTRFKFLLFLNDRRIRKADK